jgi:6-phosphogluconolactonase
MPRPVTITCSVWNSPEAVAIAAARLFADTATQAAATRGMARIAISGGSTPQAMFELLADPAQPFLAQVPWDKLELYWVDERCVPPTDTESNFRMTNEAMLSKVPLPADHVFRMLGELDPEEAASRYESTLRSSMRLEGAESPAFDLVLLGMGDDGHTASLFPHTAALHELGRLVVANHVPQKDTWRITLTSPVINAGVEVAFLIEGSAKTDVLAEVMTGPRDPERLPSQLVRPTNGKLRLLLDEAAAAKLPPTQNNFSTPAGTHRVGTLEL